MRKLSRVDQDKNSFKETVEKLQKDLEDMCIDGLISGDQGFEKAKLKLFVFIFILTLESLTNSRWWRMDVWWRNLIQSLPKILKLPLKLNSPPKILCIERLILRWKKISKMRKLLNTPMMTRNLFNFFISRTL